MHTLFAKLTQHPIIAVVRKAEELDDALYSPVSAIELRGAALHELPLIMQKARRAEKTVLLYPELIDGLAGDASGLDFLTRYAFPDGIVSTKRQVLQRARALGLLTVYQIFMIDTQAFGTGVKSARRLECDAIEVMPGIIPAVVSEICPLVDKPVLCAGLVKRPEEVQQLLAAGAAGVASSSRRLWYGAFAAGTAPQAGASSNEEVQP